MTNATYFTNVTVNAPDFADQELTFTLLSLIVSTASEVLPTREYTLTLDANGTGDIDLPVPDNTGEAGCIYSLDVEGNKRRLFSLSYSASPVTLASLLLSAVSAVTPNELAALLASYVPLAGNATMTGPLTLSADPTTDLQAATKKYVDDNAGGNPAWGDIAGALSDQVDLQSALDAKADNTDLTDHEADTTNIHGIPNTALLLETADIGVSIQAYDALLAALAALTTVADRIAYFTGVDTVALTALTSFIRTLLDDTDAATARATLGAAPTDTPTFTGLVTISANNMVFTAGNAIYFGSINYRISGNTSSLQFISNGNINLTVDANLITAAIPIKFAVYSDATRPAAGTAGRVIYNTTDGNLNIDNGTNWILPDGTTT